MTTQITSLDAAKLLLSPPGDTLLETIEALAISQTELSERMNRPLKLISEIIKGKAQIMPDTALQLENVLGVPATFWLERERRYQMELAKIKQDEKLLQESEWVRGFPLAAMTKLGWIPTVKTPLQKVYALCRFFGVADVEAWRTLFMKNTSMLNFRISLAHTQTPHALSAWLRKGDLDAGQLSLPPYNKAHFEAILEEVRNLAFEEPVGFPEKLQSLCADAGVAVVYTPCLPKAPVSGCARWLGDLPIIQLSGRYKSNDRFWFTFFHEACHILKHGKKGYFLEEVSGIENAPDKEEEANIFASDILVPPALIREIRLVGRVFEPQVAEYAIRYRVNPGVLVGRLQHEGILEKTWLNKLKTTVELFDENCS